VTDAPSPITHPLLASVGVRHGFFTRQGGVSSGLYRSLNTGIGSHDVPSAVAENRRRIAAHLGGHPDDLAACYQIHSAIAHPARSGWKGERPEGDASVTAADGVICAVLTADCAPVLLSDPEAGVVGAAHAGWKGALFGIIGSTVSAMEAQGAQRARIRAVVGPCISAASYEVGAEFLARFAHEAPGSERFFSPGDEPGKQLFDLPHFVLWRLEQAGVGEAAWTGEDTRLDEARFFSNRRAYLNGEPDFGRQMSAIVLS
jgi:YfiH family protein